MGLRNKARLDTAKLGDGITERRLGNESILYRKAVLKFESNSGIPPATIKDGHYLKSKTITYENTMELGW